MMVNKINKFALALVIFAISAVGVQAATTSGEPVTRLEKQIFKKIIGMPYYGLFDNIQFQVSDGKVVLSGHVFRASNSSSAERRIAKLDGVSSVVNQIEILPPSRFDDNIRFRTARSLGRTATISRYLIGPNPSIRIIVKRGRITLEGFVRNQSDKNLANIVANNVSGTFKVTNNLVISDGKRF